MFDLQLQLASRLPGGQLTEHYISVPWHRHGTHECDVGIGLHYICRQSLAVSRRGPRETRTHRVLPGQVGVRCKEGRLIQLEQIPEQFLDVDVTEFVGARGRQSGRQIRVGHEMLDVRRVIGGELKLEWRFLHDADYVFLEVFELIQTLCPAVKSTSFQAELTVEGRIAQLGRSG
jgi:hypothetical protein